MPEYITNKNSAPSHVAFIMDGNRRWAKNRNLAIVKGHKKGLETLENIIEAAAKIGVRYLTFFSFSTENWSRKESEVNALMNLMAEALRTKGKDLYQKGAKVIVIGRKEKLSQKLQREIYNLEQLTKNNNKILLSFAISYGGRAEIVDAVKKLKATKNITEEDIGKNLYAPEFPDPELIIRTGGQKRLSGFLLWQSAYSELYFTDTLWPDFNEVELKKAIRFFQNTQRNFGK